MASLGITVTQPQIDQFALYASQLKSWNQAANLTTITGDEEIVVKHFIDSLAPLKKEYITGDGRLLDVGTGAGFPALPLKIMRPDIAMVLLEPANKKVSFLRFIVGLLKLKDVTIFAGSLKDYAHSKLGAVFDYVTFRAVNYRLVLEDCSSLLSEKGRIVFYTSKPVQAPELGPMWKTDQSFSFNLPGNYGSRVISLIEKSEDITKEPAQAQCSTWNRGINN